MIEVSTSPLPFELTVIDTIQSRFISSIKMFSEAVKNKLSCAAFFFLPGLSYSLVTSRMPAIKESAHIDDLQLGIALFCLGIAGCIGLFFSSKIVRLLKDRPTIAVGASLGTIGLVISGCATSFASLVPGFAVIGFGIGLTDALMNAQGMFYERRYKTRSMNLFHAFFSLGGIVGSLAASLCAYLGLSPLFSFLVLVVPWTFVCLFGCRYLQEEDQAKKTSTASQSAAAKRSYPLVLICFGLLSWLAYDIEGSVAEWGSVYMVSSKEADQAVAALVYGLFSGTIFVVRLFGDRLRESVGDFRLLPVCSLIAFCGMSVVLLSASPATALCGYIVMGLGLAPVVPTIFSLAGKCKGISASEASSFIAIVAYGGLLVVPPTLGWIASHSSLGTALCLVLVFCALAFVISLILPRLKVQLNLSGSLEP